jgi:hypothetical protein
MALTFRCGTLWMGRAAACSLPGPRPRRRDLPRSGPRPKQPGGTHDFRWFGLKTGGDGFWRFGLKTCCDVLAVWPQNLLRRFYVV